MITLGELVIPFTYIILFVVFVARNEHRLTKMESNIDWIIKNCNERCLLVESKDKIKDIMKDL